MEWDKAKHIELNEKYHKSQGCYDIHEIQQIGFRLADKLGHDKVYAVNWEGRMTNEDMGKLHNTILNTYPEVLKKVASLQETIPSISKGSPLLTSYQELNNERLIAQMEELYWSFACVQDENGGRIGIEFLNKWLEREMMIFKNIIDITDDASDERILLLIGSDHLWSLKMLFEKNGWDVILPFAD
ncbi:DUF5694 domain-containing protein [Bacillus sp. SCS-153A]|uniref:DUF5694 domain-containing protein n=1 Tax=Rossellomorea sedimentorum TaxID=3115294 RepID=UPI0039068C99